MQTATPLKGQNLITWIGGKRLLRRHIAELVPSDIKSFIDVFGGAGWVLFFRERWAGLEVYNDLDGRLVNLFRIVKYHPDELQRELQHMPHSRRIFEQVLASEPLTDIQAAARFCYLMNRSFGGKGTQYGRSLKGSPSGKNPSRINELITALSVRLDKVRIEQLDFSKALADFDKPGAFFYCDPPYYSSSETNRGTYDALGGEDFDHQRLREALGTVNGRWLLSYDDSAAIRRMYEGYNVVEISRAQGITQPAKRYHELLISNYTME